MNDVFPGAEYVSFPSGAETAYSSGAPEITPLCCQFFVDLRIHITPLVSSNSSYVILFLFYPSSLGCNGGVIFSILASSVVDSLSKRKVQILVYWES